MYIWAVLEVMANNNAGVQVALLHDSQPDLICRYEAVEAMKNVCLWAHAHGRNEIMSIYEGPCWQMFADRTCFKKNMNLSVCKDEKKMLRHTR